MSMAIPSSSMNNTGDSNGDNSKAPDKSQREVAEMETSRVRRRRIEAVILRKESRYFKYFVKMKQNKVLRFLRFWTTLFCLNYRSGLYSFPPFFFFFFF